MGMSDHAPAQDIPRVLFLSGDDACCGRVAAAFARALGAGGLIAESAAWDPAPSHDPLAARLLLHHDLPLDLGPPRKVDAAQARAADLIVLLGVPPSRLAPALRWRAQAWDPAHPASADEPSMALHLARLRARVEDLLQRAPAAKGGASATRLL